MSSESTSGDAAGADVRDAMDAALGRASSGAKEAAADAELGHSIAKKAAAQGTGTPFGSETDSGNDPDLAAEQSHLTEVYSTLVRMEGAIELKMEATRKEAAEAKRKMSEEIAGDYTGFDEALETYADVEAANRIIEGYNISQDADADRLSRIRVLLRQPYFAKVVLEYEGIDGARDIYIGNAGMTDEDYRYLVIDWRSPVAEVYYSCDYGPTSYVANGRTIHVDLRLRRQFDIERDRLNACFDTTVAIQDPLLVKSLSRARSSRMRDITATIQREQNLVVRHEDVPALLVEGIAGSGKTSVLLQRIAYLLYMRREELDPEQVYLITPNPVFRSYIEGVLPDLGERNPQALTWDEFAASAMPDGRPRGGIDASMDVLSRIDSSIGALAFESGDFRDVESEGVKLITAARIAQVARRLSAKIPMGPHLVTLIREDILGKLESRLRKLASSEKVLDEVCDLSLSEQLRIFGEAVDPADEEELPNLALRYVTSMHGGAAATVERDEWLRIDRIGMRMLGVEGLTTVEWLYLKMRLTGMGDPKAAYVIVDEVQDYSTGQLALLAGCFPNARFMLLGDENQAIRPGTASFAEVIEIFERTRGEASRCRLMTSYRSTPSITRLFATLMAPGEGLEVSSVRRDDHSPEIVVCDDSEELAGRLAAAAREAREADGLFAFIVPRAKDARRVEEMLGDDAPQIVDAHGQLPDSGVVMVELVFAKGLEFDGVVVPDVSERAFPADDLSRRRLYTTVSRATRHVRMFCLGRPTRLLDAYLESVGVRLE